MIVDVASGIYIDGEWILSERANLIKVINPSTKETMGEVPLGGRKETVLPIEAAKKAFHEWSDLTGRERSIYLYKAYQLMIERKEYLATILTKEQGKPLKESRGEIEFAASFLLWYAEEAGRVYGEIISSSKKNKRLLVVPQAIGIVAAITPWNFPSAMVTRKIAPVLAAGCTVVLKPAEQTPFSAIEIVKIFEEVGLPKGVLNIVTGDVEEIGISIMESNDVRAITFTGSTEVGKLLMKGSAENVKKMSLELGGHAPLIVFEDADIELAAKQAVASKFRNNGQTCICTNRLFVHESILDDFLLKLKNNVSQLKLGNGLDPSTDIGPLIDSRGIEKVIDQVEDAKEKGGRILAGGKNWEELAGCYYEPTILSNVSNDMKIMTEETFGPVIPVKSFSNEDEVITMANDTPYGLAAFLFTSNINRGIRVMEKLEYGIVGINDVFPGTAEAPFGGIKESGVGREGGREGIKEFIEMKYVSISLK